MSTAVGFRRAYLQGSFFFSNFGIVMKARESRWPGVALLLLWAAACFVFFQWFYRYHLFFNEQNHLFTFTTSQLLGYFDKPAWLACLAGDFLTQFFYYAYAGPAVLTLALMGTALLARAAARRLGLAPSVSTVLALVLVAAMLFGWVKGTYNGLVKSQENVNAAWAQVENVYQRRADLVPNLVATVKGYAQHEQQTLEAVINARAAATSVKIDPSNMTDTDLKKFQDAQGELAGALSRLIAVSESYPELKANQNFLESQLEGTENRITVERQKFNDVARAYNTEVRTFPTVILASIFGFDKRPYFESQASADKAPKVDFGA